MTRKIKTFTYTDGDTNTDIKPVKVRIIKAPLVNTTELRGIIIARARAVVL